METKDRIQLIWGIALVGMGVAFIFRFPDVLERISDSGHPGIFHFFLKLCMFLVSIILIGGGIKKLIHARQVLMESASTGASGDDDK